MSESPVTTLQRWEDAGAVWRVVEVSGERAVIDLCECTGEPVERLESADPELLRFLERRAE